MGLESANFISELVPSNPLDTDDPQQGAAQIRVTKNALFQSFQNVDKAVNTNADELNQLAGLVLRELQPVGAVTMWTTVTPPNGWLLCDGAPIDPSHTALIALLGANTPDLQDVFVRGSGVGRNPLTTELENVGAHSHDESTVTYATKSVDYSGAAAPFNLIEPPATTNTKTTTNNPTGENRPANTALMYIIKT